MGGRGGGGGGGGLGVPPASGPGVPSDLGEFPAVPCTPPAEPGAAGNWDVVMGENSGGGLTPVPKLGGVAPPCPRVGGAVKVLVVRMTLPGAVDG